MTQADHVISKCGGVPVVSEITGASVSRVYRWRMSKDRGGTGGLIPSSHHVAILNGARARGIDLSPADFFPQEAAK